MQRVTYALRPLPPFRLDLTVWALRREAVNAVDQWDGRAYRRVMSEDGMTVGLEVTQTGTSDSPELQVTVCGEKNASGLKHVSTRWLERLLGVRADLESFYSLSSGDRLLKPLAERFRGVKPPRFSTPFEALVNGIACQQISLTAGIRLLNRLAAAHGKQEAYPLTTPMHAFPEPADLSGLGRLQVFPGDDAGARLKLRMWLGLSEVPDYDGSRHLLEKWTPYGGMVYFHLLLKHIADLGWINE